MINFAIGESNRGERLLSNCGSLLLQQVDARSFVASGVVQQQDIRRHPIYFCSCDETLQVLRAEKKVGRSETNQE